MKVWHGDWFSIPSSIAPFFSISCLSLIRSLVNVRSRKCHGARKRSYEARSGISRLFSELLAHVFQRVKVGNELILLVIVTWSIPRVEKGLT